MVCAGMHEYKELCFFGKTVCAKRLTNNDEERRCNEKAKRVNSRGC